MADLTNNLRNDMTLHEAIATLVIGSLAAGKRGVTISSQVVWRDIDLGKWAITVERKDDQA